MGILDRFRSGKKNQPDPVSDLTLAKLEPGYLVDFDLKTWEVTARNTYDWGEGDLSHEWRLVSGDDAVFLELESDDEEDWSLNRKIPFNRLEAGLKEHILEKGDPPRELTLEGRTFYLEEMAGGHFLKDGQRPGQPLLSWSYEDDEGETYLTLEQWGEEDFEAFLGRPVEEYQFTNILPREG